MRLQPADVRFIPTGVAYFAGAARTPGPPVFFTIETINQCNLRCVYCPQSRPAEHFRNGRGRMTLAQFATILDRLQDAFRPQMISLHRDGEPLLNPEIDAFIAEATARRIAVSFSTNASLLTPALSGRLVDAGLRMINTDFCADSSVYEDLRAGARWKRTYAGLLALLAAAEERAAPLRIVIKDLAAGGPIPANSRRALQATRELFRDHAARVHVIPVRFHNALGQSRRDLSQDRKVKGPATYGLCHQPWVSMTIDWAGRVVGCCRDLRSEYVLGNILEQAPEEIWNGEPMRLLRTALAQKRPQDIVTCRSCDLPWQGSYSGNSPAGRMASFLFGRTHSQG